MLDNDGHDILPKVSIKNFLHPNFTSTILNFRDHLLLNNHHNYHFNTEVKILCVGYLSLPNVVVSAFAVVLIRAETRADDAGDVAGTAVDFSESDAEHDHQFRRNTTPIV